MTRHEFERIEYLAARRAKLVASKTPINAIEIEHERAVLREEVKQERIRGAMVANAAFDYFLALHSATEDETEAAPVCDECGKPGAESVDGGLRGERFLCRAHAARAIATGEGF